MNAHTHWLKLTLNSDTTFGRGDGVAGLVDAEVQHDEYGFPYLGGKTLKGMLGATCAEILYALDKATPSHQWNLSARYLFGSPGSGRDESAHLHVGDACLPEDLRQMIIYEEKLSREEVLESLTALRRQTAMDASTGAPLKESLRTMRVIIRDTPFIARLDFKREPKTHELALLAACVKAFRRAGTGRNRGRGRLTAALYAADPLLPESQPVTDDYFSHFQEVVEA